MQLSVVHRTVLEYNDDIADTSMEMRLRPRDDAGQRLLAYRLIVEPDGPVRSYRDGFGNLVEVYNHRPPHRRIVVEARSVVETSVPTDAPSDAVLPEGERYRLLRFDGPIVEGPELHALLGKASGIGERPADALLLAELAGVIRRELVYEQNVTRVDSTVEDLLRLGRGVCQDFAHLWVALCRALYIPARYVSGYIWNGDNRQEQASHAWGEAWIPGLGWLGYDPTNWTEATGGRVGAQHIRIAVGRDYRDVPPTRGVFRGAAQETLSVDVRVVELTPAQVPTAIRA
jgi:transglutaminase-like putative cysteine protease